MFYKNVMLSYCTTRFVQTWILHLTPEAKKTLYRLFNWHYSWSKLPLAYAEEAGLPVYLGNVLKRSCEEAHCLIGDRPIDVLSHYSVCCLWQCIVGSPWSSHLKRRGEAYAMGFLVWRHTRLVMQEVQRGGGLNKQVCWVVWNFSALSSVLAITILVCGYFGFLMIDGVYQP